MLLCAVLLWLLCLSLYYVVCVVIMVCMVVCLSHYCYGCEQCSFVVTIGMHKLCYDYSLLCYRVNCCVSL